VLTLRAGHWPHRVGDVKEMEEIALELAEKQRLAETAR
jgi:hypothetical protein